MIRLIGATLLAICASYASGVQSRPFPASATVSDSLPPHGFHGNAVILSDGLMIGRVASAWSGGTRLVILRIILDAGAGLSSGELTLTVPEPIDAHAPIRLFLSRRALGEILADDNP